MKIEPAEALTIFAIAATTIYWAENSTSNRVASYGATRVAQSDGVAGPGTKPVPLYPKPQ